MIVVGLISAYKEGRLVRGAIESLRRVGLDELYVWEGPAGESLGDDVPDSDYPESWLPNGVIRGRWRSDARKRNAMLQAAKRQFPNQELWGVIVDGDEVLWNAEYLRDQLQAVSWNDQHRGADWNDPQRPPTARIPIRMVERDGTVSIITARIVRLDLLSSIDISSSVVTNTHGIQEGWGNFPERSPIWVDGWLHALEQGNIIAWPPFPCEPCLVHRAHLRHPLRRGLRMSEQETVELDKAKRAAFGPP